LVSAGDLGGSVGVSTATPSYKGRRYPVEIINHCVWLYFRFPLSFGEVEEPKLARGVAVSYETIRRSGICAHFRPRRQLLSVTEWRTEMADRFAVWSQVTRARSGDRTHPGA
jgi:hypothetical protein